MKYLAALPVFVLLLLLDVLILASCGLVVGLFVILEMRDYPTCRSFAEKVWT